MILTPAKRLAVVYNGFRAREVSREFAAKRLRRMRQLGRIERQPRFTNDRRDYLIVGLNNIWSVTV